MKRRFLLRGLMLQSLPVTALVTLSHRAFALQPKAEAAAAGARTASAGAVTASAVARHYADSVFASYQDTLGAARELQVAIGALVARPSETGLVAARNAWLAARNWYGQTEAYRFYGGPIDAEDGPEGRLNSWPLDESFIDGVPEQPQAGIISDRQVAITKAALSENNERGGEENISTGWHAIEFLLWGQDLSDDGPGARPFTDFVDGGRPNADRRREYLQVVTELLIDDLQLLVAAWTPGQSNYRASFEQGGMESVRKIIVGLGSLSRGELAGERLEVAMSTQDQEDEHSCFSDNTHNDIVANALGIANVWQGRYRRRDGMTLQGASLRELVAAAAAGVAGRTTRSIDASVQAARAIQAPFDREIIGGDDAPGRVRIRKTIDSLVQQSKDLVESASALGITRLTLTTP